MKDSEHLTLDSLVLSEESDDSHKQFAVASDDVSPQKRTVSSPSFQAASSKQGRQFAEQCDLLLENTSFSLGRDRLVVPDTGVEIDREARSRIGTLIWFEYKGSLQGTRPGLIRTDTLKKAIANGALLRTLPDHPPYVVLTSHLPTAGAGLHMLQTALRLGYFHDVICVYDPKQRSRLDSL